MNSRALFVIIISLLMMATVAEGCDNKALPPPPDGVLIGVVTGIDKVVEEGLGWTVYTVRVVQDSTYTGALAVANRGELIKLRSPGVDGWAEFSMPGNISIHTVSMSRDETIRSQYLVVGGNRVPTVKYTVWKKGQDLQNRQPAVMATRFEAWLMDSRNAPVFGDSLQLYASTWVPEVFADPIPDNPKHPQLNWLTNHGSLMISPGTLIGTLNEVKQQEAVSMERR